MKMTFRWYGEGDPIPLKYIKQIPNMSGVVTAVYDVPVGEVWPEEKIARLANLCRESGLELEVIESVPVHEDIKLGKPSRDSYIDNYKQTLRNLGKCGIKCVCYNFMPVFDWLRTDLKFVDEADGSNSLAYNHEQLIGLDIKNLSLPGWDESYTKEELNGLLKQYEDMTHEELFENLVYFLEQIMPVCEEMGINMAIHPDDPPWDMFGLPRIITGERSYEKLFSAVPARRNGITFCSGSLGADRFNHLVRIIEKFANRIFFAHLRNIKYTGAMDFKEVAHYSACGSLDMYAIVKALVEKGFDGYVRPDHGRNIWGEDSKPGYGLYDRALGAAYLNGLFEAAKKERGK
ncbi:MAG: mannonate dehydratase [Clostridiales bacterium]|nr:mannonate dehydratase [Clostridiales bacterium]